MSVETDLLQLDIQHQVDVQRYGQGVAADLANRLGVMEREVAGVMLYAQPPRITGPVADVARVMRTGYENAWRLLRDASTALMRVEADYQSYTFQARGKDVKAPNLERVEDELFSKPYVGRTWTEWTEGLQAQAFIRVRDDIRIGAQSNESAADITQRLVGTAQLNFADGQLTKNRRHLEGMVKTTLNNAMNTTRLAYYEKNSPQVIWISVLDALTSTTCASLHGRVFDHDDGPRPPLHWNCRSAIYPFDPASPVKVVRFNTWLQSLSAAEQDELLGPTRGALFRRGGLKISRFVNRAGDELTIAQLRKRDGEAFRRANL